MEINKVNGDYYARVARGSFLRLSALCIVLFGFGCGMGISLVVVEVLRDTIASTERSKAMIQAASTLAISNAKELDDIARNINR